MARRLTLALSLGLLASCGIPGARPLVLDPTPRPAASPDALEVFTSAPEREYRVIATWRTEESSTYGSQAEVLRKRALHEAAALGADAVILTLEDDSGLALDPGSETGITVFGYVTKAAAQFIVWR